MLMINQVFWEKCPPRGTRVNILIQIHIHVTPQQEQKFGGKDEECELKDTNGLVE
jgi:hypothetical protein